MDDSHCALNRSLERELLDLGFQRGHPVAEIYSVERVLERIAACVASYGGSPKSMSLVESMPGTRTERAEFFPNTLRRWELNGQTTWVASGEACGVVGAAVAHVRIDESQIWEDGRADLCLVQIVLPGAKSTDRMHWVRVDDSLLARI